MLSYEEIDMKSRLFPRSVPTYLILMAFFVTAATAQDNSPTNPAGKGVPVKSIVEIGSTAASNYDVVITLVEVVRGKEALSRLQSANANNKAPKAGFECVLARIKFELKGRAVSDNRPFDLATSPFQWVAYSSDIRQYDGTSAISPKPELKGNVRPGETMEGWLAFEVEQSESKPIMIFDPASGGAIGRGKPLFFKLY
jgi:uncharacterized protein DUF4352